VADDYHALAPAKLNLVLEVLGPRPDGYHEIDTVFQEIALADRVTVSFGRADGVTVSGPYAAGTPCDATNLAWRAAERLAARAGTTTAGLSIHLHKEIPPAGGLGGGASDAAAVLKLLAAAWPGVTPEMVRSVAEEIGSDEVFFLVGGTARGRGRGEVVTPLPSLPLHDVVLFIPAATIERKTAQMFAALDALPFEPGHATEKLASVLPGSVTPADLSNTFERVAWEIFPGLDRLRHAVEGRIAGPVRLAGAGPTLFWIGPPGKGRPVAAAAAGLDCTVVLTSTAAPR